MQSARCSLAGYSRLGLKGRLEGRGVTDRSEVADRLLDAVDWSAYSAATGPASDIGEALRALLSSSNVDESTVAWGRIEEFVFSQGTIYSSAEPTVSVLLAALTQNQPTWRSGRILDLLYFIVNGSSPNDSLLRARCHARALEGFWLLVQWANQHQGWDRESALEVIEAVAPDRVDFVRRAISAE